MLPPQATPTPIPLPEHPQVFETAKKAKEKKQADYLLEQVNSTQKPEEPNQKLLNSVKPNRYCNARPNIINTVYSVVGNTSLVGAVITAILMVATDMDAPKKEAVGGLTIGLIVTGAFCFWHLAYCPQKNQKSDYADLDDTTSSTSVNGGYQSEPRPDV